MAETTFRAQALTETGRRENGTRFIFTFENAQGDKQTISMPVSIAANLGPVIADLSATLELAVGGPGFSKRVESWAVGRSEETPEVTLRLGELVFSLHVDDVKKMWRELRAETDAIDRRPARPRH